MITTQVNDTHDEWPIHVKHVSPCNIQDIIEDMRPALQTQTRHVLQYFQVAFLAAVPISHLPSIIELSAPQIVFLLKVGLFEKIDAEIPLGPRLHIFLVLEHHKQRWRLIVHTMDINRFSADYAVGELNFEELQTMIEFHLERPYFVYQNDAAAYYHQFLLPKETRRFYSFFVEGFGKLALTTIATGQRQCVEVAQCVSRHLNEKAGRMARNLVSQSAYIDNFKGAAIEEKDAAVGAAWLLRVANYYNVTMNDSLQKPLQSFEHRGILFEHNRTMIVRLGSKTSLKVQDLRTHRLNRIADWSIVELQQVFGLLIYASAVLNIPMHIYYYCFKLVRRRMHQLALGELTIQGSNNETPARVWPSTFVNWIDWTDKVASHPGRLRHPQPIDTTHVLVSDASMYGCGGVCFDLQRNETSTFGSSWSAMGIAASQHHINVLEMKALIAAVHRLLPSGAKVQLLVDNTTVMHTTRKQYSASFALNAHMKDFPDDVTIVSIDYIKSAENPADALSRGAQEQDLNEQLLVKTLERGRAGRVEGAD